MLVSTYAAVIDPAAAATNLRAWIIIALGVILLLISAAALLKARKGDNGIVARIVTASLIALLPAGIAGIGALVFADELVGLLG